MKHSDYLKEVLEILQEGGSILPGTLSKLTQRSDLKSRSYWYLTWKEEGRSRAIYIHSEDVPQVSKGIENMKKVKEYLFHIAMENLRKMREQRDVRKKG